VLVSGKGYVEGVVKICKGDVCWRQISKKGESLGGKKMVKIQEPEPSYLSCIHGSSVRLLNSYCTIKS